MDESAFTLLRRLRLRFSAAGIVLAAIAAIIVIALAWVGSAQPSVAALELVALDASGRFSDSLGVDAVEAPAGPRFPLVLAVRNVGETPAAPDSLYLSLPIRFRLEDKAGESLPSRHGPGSPLARYGIPLGAATVQPGAQPAVLPGVDTLWIAPWLPDYYCVLGPAGVPDFVPAPEYDPSRLAEVLVFYGFDTRSGPRQTGLLRLHLPPAALRARAGPALPMFPTERIGPGAPLPELPALFEIGARAETCSDPDQALVLRSVLWETPDGGRVIALHHDSIARKRLYDLDRDSIVELVIWDADGDGVFDARRRARFPIPRWLLPRVAAAADRVAADSAAVDSIGTVADTSGAARGAGAGRAGAGGDSTRTRTDTTAARRDTAAMRADTLTARRDTIGPRTNAAVPRRERYPTGPDPAQPTGS